MRNIKELKKIARKNPGKYVVVSTSEDDNFEGVLLSRFLSREVVKAVSNSEGLFQDSNSDNLISKGIFLFDGTGVNFVFYEGIEIIRVYDSPMFEEDSKKMIGYFKDWLHAHS
ncbi:hypothetical protein AB1J02_29455 [Bacillus paranthracis]|uniref:hypothetical protein n=1 Tax=Bacillus TaxID=1386 RepID=UPI001262A102|nr:hypothetical protein [Bacillus sp. B4-WWTP-NA-D-NA-NA]KAB7630282.1 hypothetical protein GBN96_28600 [Bacillus sp. B4-WWTP-NA-D-NA-NA]